MSFRRKVFALTIALLTSIALGTIVIHEGAGRLAERELNVVLAGLPAAKIPSVTVDPWRRRVEIKGILAANPSMRLSVGKLSYNLDGSWPFPTVISSAFALDGTAVAENITIEAGPAKYTMKRIEASGTALTSAELAAILDQSSSTPLLDRVQKLSATSILIPEVTAEYEIGDKKQKIVYHDIKLADVVKGRIGAASAAAASFEGTSPDLGALTGAYGGMTAKNIDIALVARIMSGPRTDPNEALKPIYDSFTVDGFTLKADKGFELQVGKMTGRDIKARPLTIPLSDIRTLIRDRKTMGDMSPEESKRLLGLISDIFDSIEIGGMEVRDIKVKPPSDSGNQGAFKITRIAISNIAKARFGEIIYEGFNLDSPDAKVSLGSFALRGFNLNATFSSLKTALATGNEGFKGLDPREAIPTLDQIALTNLDFDVADQKKEGNAADGARDRFKVGRIELDFSGFIKGVPTAITAEIGNFAMDVPSDAKQGPFKGLSEIGQSKLDLSTRFDIAWNEATEELAVKDLSLKGAGMGAVAVKGTFGNVSKEAFTGDVAMMQAALLGSMIKNVDLKIENKGVFEKFIEMQAKKMRKTPDQVRKDAISTAAVGIPGALGNAPGAKTIANAVAKFIANPNNLHITLKAPDGIGASDMALLGNPAELLKKVEITATANE